jgi:hypothetical protein
MRKLFVLGLGLSALIGCANDSLDDVADDDSADVDPVGDVDEDGAASSLAEERGISLADATQRMAWQDKLDDLDTALQSSLGASFASVWIDPDHGDRVQIAVTADASAIDIMAIAQQLGVDTGTDVVRVQRSQAQLQLIVDDVIAQTGGDDANVAVGIDPIANAVTIAFVPGSPMTGTLANDLVRKYGAAIQVQSPVNATPAQTSFDPPMRGGVKMFHSDNGGTHFCTTGFFARRKAAPHTPYIISAGHCVTGAGNSGAWSANFANGSTHGLTNGGTFKVNAGGDMAALKMINVATWTPKPRIVVQKSASTSFNARYGITGNGASHVGMRVCHTGITSGTHCGTIRQIDVPITYDGVTIVGHQVKAHMIGKSGDSGGPVFANHKAFGTMSATGDTGVSYYNPIGQIEAQLGVEVVHLR